MAPMLVLGPLLRYVGAEDATVWVETDAACEVEVRTAGRTRSARTFSVEGHHYALVVLEDLEPDTSHEYSVALDGQEVWPEPGSGYPASRLRTIAPDGDLTLVFGSCRVAAPHEPPYTLKRGRVKRGGVSGQRFEQDALYALADEMRRAPTEDWPDALVMLGDQIYADEPSAGAMDFIRSRRDPDHPPGVADFEEYTSLYKDAWGDPTLVWLLSAVPSTMIFDDHDVHDDWNTSDKWVAQMRQKWWWEERIVGAFMSYWIYQHLGNLSPRELEADDLFQAVRETDDATRLLREFAHRASSEDAGSRWSFYRDFGKTRLIVLDSRAGRVLDEERRSMLDDEEWAWVEDKASGDFDHLLIGTSLPLLLSPGLHHLEAWNEAVCRGAWGAQAARLGEAIRQAVDLEHWAAFSDSFASLAKLIESVGAGKRSENGPPASITVLSGDVHHGYLAEVSYGDGVQSSVHQAVSSPLRNPLGTPERLGLRAGWSKTGAVVGRTLAHLAGVKDPTVSWRLTHKEPWFDNHISTLEIHGREATIKVEKSTPEDEGEPKLQEILQRRLA